ncbi:60S ribosomal protein L7 [Rhodotorula kratochvilovae]
MEAEQAAVTRGQVEVRIRLLDPDAFLWPFKLSNPNGGFRTRKAPQWICAPPLGGESGKREQFINALVKKCN